MLLLNDIFENFKNWKNSKFPFYNSFDIIISSISISLLCNENNEWYVVNCFSIWLRKKKIVFLSFFYWIEKNHL